MASDCPFPRHSTATAVAVWLLASVASACPYTIRDAGFIVRDPSPYRLYVCVDDGTPGRERLDEWMAAAMDESLRDSNVEAEVVNTDQSPDHEATAMLASLGIEELPAAILVSPTENAVRVPGLAADDLSDRGVRAVVAASVSSPRRDELKGHLVEHWCVMVLAEGTNGQANARARAAAQAAAKKAVGMSSELGQTVRTEPYLLSVAADDPEEAALVSSLGLREGDRSDPRLAVVFGVGRRLGPVLRGAEISERSVMDYLETLGRSCTCTSDPAELLGPSVPLEWDEGIRSEVRQSLGFDPDRPEVRIVLAGVWQSQMVPGGSKPFGQADEYMEFPVETAAAPFPSDAENPAGSAALGRRTARTVVVALAVMALLVVGAGAALFLRHVRSRD